jgi:hypothetical protein
MTLTDITIQKMEVQRIPCQSTDDKDEGEEATHTTDTAEIPKSIQLLNTSHDGIMYNKILKT